MSLETKMKTPLKIVFMGTPHLAAVHLESLLQAPENFHLKAVYTRPDKPKGRSSEPAPSEVKVLAQIHGRKVIQVPDFKSETAVAELASYEPDVIVVVAFGMILPETVLKIPKYGAINIHTSLLPKYRGASPIQQALLHGEAMTGVTSFLLDPGIDTGNILLQKEVGVDLKDDYFSLSEKLANIGVDCLKETLFRISESEMTFRGHPQDHNQPSDYAKKITKEMAKLDFSKPALTLHNQVRALDSWPVCSIEALVDGTQGHVKIHKTLPVTPCPVCQSKKPGEASVVGKNQLHLRCADGCLSVLELQLQGKKRTETAAFLNGHRIDKITG